MSHQFLTEAQRGLPRIAQPLSLLPVALTALARIKPEYTSVINHYQILRQFSEIQDGMNHHLMPEGKPLASHHWFLGMTNIRDGFTVGVSYDTKEKAIVFICAQAKKDMREIMEEDVCRAAQSVKEDESRSAFEQLRTSANSISIIRLVEKEDGIQIVASAEGEKRHLPRLPFAAGPSHHISYTSPFNVENAKPFMHFMHGVVNKLVDGVIARQMILTHHPFLYR